MPKLLSALFFLSSISTAFAQESSSGAPIAPNAITEAPILASLPGLNSGPDLNSGNGGVFVELIAADFYEHQLRLSQSRRIEAATAKRYLSLTETERARYRAERRKIWTSMSETERAALRSVKRPKYANLDEWQKQTFRRIASDELGGSIYSAGNAVSEDDV
ncbi:hypothetical protein [Hyphococcus sp. DH-69]|uniref:hypothetical protein n=1 Tax=Hyphococcus formosus TaxID=3143534 RepID=UPI00398AF70A